MSTETGTPQAPVGFQARTPDEPTGPKVPREFLAPGFIVQFRGTRKFPRTENGIEKFSTVHTFLANGGEGQRFSAYGTAQLDSLLRTARLGDIIWLRYAGLEEVEGNRTHTWFVSEARRGISLEQLRTMRQHYKTSEVELDRVITDARQVQRGQAEGASHPADAADADDLPY